MTHPTLRTVADPLSPSPGTPGEGRGEGSSPRTHNASFAVSAHSVLSTQHSVLFSACLLLLLAASAPLYHNDFEQLQPNTPPPDDFRLHEGSFTIHSDPTNKYLRLSSFPLAGSGFSLGPSDQPLLCLSARIRSDSTAARRPEFGLGLNGLGAYKLWLIPMTSELQLLKADDVKATIPYSWQSGQWTRLKLRLRQTSPTTWRLEGKAWPDTQPEPSTWQISFDDSEKPTPGQPSLWGTPYSDKPIDFDDILIEQSN